MVRLYAAGDPPPSDVIRRYRYRRTSAALYSLILGSVVAWLLWVGWVGGVVWPKLRGGLPGFIGWWAGAWLGLFWLLHFFSDVRKRFAPSNWLALLTPAGIHIKFRSYRNNRHDPRDLRAVFLPFAEIAWTRRVGQRLSLPQGQGEQRQENRRYVELGLKPPNLTPLRQALADELEGYSGGHGAAPRHKLKARHLHYPVALHGENVLRIEWSAITPSAQDFLRRLAVHGISMQDAATETRNLAADAPRAEDLDDLARRGDTLGLIKLLRQQDREMDLTTARRQSEQLIAARRQKTEQ